MSVDTSVLERLAVRTAGEDLLHRYQRLVDAKDVAGLGRIVVDDVELQRRQGPRRGRAEFVRLYQDFADSDVEVAQHMVSNIQVSPLDDGKHRIDSAFFVLTTHEAGGARMVWGRYCDDMVRVGDDWRFCAKRIEVVRTALIPEESLVSGDVSSFGPMEPQQVGRQTGAGA
ncbi:nuclear transport factor 2 family protein [Nocardioides soli]|uniref:Ketosteroid isomerase-like protein n=1 Tax=Nocardioides soli TaxID=1036020 RepID=A0A7W4Z1S3_9ACTN|nr:nuclear transport factor 2 family protein [Nocardioides soli]MBB3043172.1 ketosteroid isomerase-like protein [Nocardioides soli]